MREAYRPTTKDSVYLRPDWQHRGIGSALLAELIRRGQALGFRSIVAVISGNQAVSIRLHEKFIQRRHGDGTYVAQVIPAGKLEVRQLELLRRDAENLAYKAVGLNVEPRAVHELLDEALAKLTEKPGARTRGRTK